MRNPFESERDLIVLINQARQCSLWPAELPPPHGWTPRHGPATRAECVEYVEQVAGRRG
ncbi:MbtH family NRPS accessory protein [Micromonospora sp. B006]|uniref:MbtH family NRPS accessory protein n=1 Tax=Micromonospora sp. B006 TaxID=2201999 RepID=UPI000E30B37E|nr:MbtH family NRPS accessory protein [Micromonospora sp. B006]